MSIVMQGFLGSLGAGSMTALGALPVLFGRSMSRRTMDVMLGFAAGVMLAATFFSLLGPSVAYAAERHGAGLVPAAIAVIGVLLGAGTVMFFDNRLPHEHFIVGREGPEAAELRRIWLFVFAITLHNAPEGMAVGVGFGGGDFAAGAQIALGIGVQNAPEGLAVAVALMSKDYSRRYAFLVAALTGLVEPVTGLVAAVAVSLFSELLPWAMAYAAGAMLYVISHEIIPETHRHGHQRLATQGLLFGFVLMMALDVALG